MVVYISLAFPLSAFILTIIRGIGFGHETQRRDRMNLSWDAVAFGFVFLIKFFGVLAEIYFLRF
jgi:hypothetical protein